MSQVLLQFWVEEDGAIISSELILVLTILVLGMIVGLATLRDSVVAELADLAAAIGSVNQSYSFAGLSGHSSSTAGSFFVDATDFCEDGSTDDPGVFENCITLVPPSEEFLGT